MHEPAGDVKRSRRRAHPTAVVLALAAGALVAYSMLTGGLTHYAAGDSRYVSTEAIVLVEVLLGSAVLGGASWTAVAAYRSRHGHSQAVLLPAFVSIGLWLFWFCANVLLASG